MARLVFARQTIACPSTFNLWPILACNDGYLPVTPLLVGGQGKKAVYMIVGLSRSGWKVDVCREYLNGSSGSGTAGGGGGVGRRGRRRRRLREQRE